MRVVHKFFFSTMYFELENYKMLEGALKEISAFLKSMGLSEDSVFDSKLVVTELVTNVFQHSTGAAYVEGELDGDTVKIKVRSSTSFVPPEKSLCSGVLEESGRGLFLIDSVSEERSCSPDGAVCVRLKVNYIK